MSLEWFNLCPGLAPDGPVFPILSRCIEALRQLDAEQETLWNEISQQRDQFFGEVHGLGEEEVQARTCISAVCDLVLQGWHLRTSDTVIEAAQPSGQQQPGESSKDRVRNSLLIERNAQLRESATRLFIQKMEERRYYRNDWVSVYSLMRDGRELAEKLRVARELPEPTQHGALRNTIDPYLQCVDGSRCEHTGLLLKEIWRYFRHTWVTTYQSVPGRNIWFLIRDRAAKFHPVIGIAALGSAIVQLTVRDQWIGWNRDSFLAWAKAHPSNDLAQWIWSSLGELMDGIYIADFLEEGLLSPQQLAAPDDEAIDRLRQFARDEKLIHRRYPHTAEHKSGDVSAETWAAMTQTYLYRGKRADTLAALLRAKQFLIKSGFDSPTLEGLSKGLAASNGRNAIAEIVRHVKGIHVGNDMMDIMVCGAVQPYSAVLGGKLVSLLMTSPEVAEAYNARYRNTPSIIASSMAGRPVHRKPQLVFLGTTSLYGERSSQYNRLRLPASEIGGPEGAEIRYHELGRTEGFGSYHFSDATLIEMERLLARHGEGRRVNSIFGEGVNPRLRKIRDALQLAGFHAESLLNHGDRRIIYGIPLATNFREILLGMESMPKSIFPYEPPHVSTSRIADYWIRRWLSARVQRDEVLEQVASHNLLYPIRHGARVLLPDIPEDAPLFSE